MPLGIPSSLRALLAALLTFMILVSGAAVTASNALTPATAGDVPPPAGPAGRTCGTWVLQQVTSATDLNRQAAAISSALSLPGVVGFSLRVPWDALENDPTLLDKGLAIAEAKGKEFAIRFMAGRWTPDRVFAAGAYSYTSNAGDKMPAPFAPNGTPGNPVFEREYGATVAWLASWSRAHDVSVLHVPWYGFLWAEIYNGDEVEALPGYSWESWLEGHSRLAAIALSYSGPDLAVEFALSGHWGTHGAGAGDVADAIVDVSGPDSGEAIVQGNGHGLYNSKTTNRPIVHAKQMYDGADYDWKNLYSILVTNDERYLEVYSTSFALPNKAILAAEALKFSQRCDSTGPDVSLSGLDSEVSGQVPLSATAADESGVSSMEILVDGAVVASGAGSALDTVWDTTTVSNGPHVVSARATDTRGNQGTSDPVTVQVENGVAPPVLSVDAVTIVEGNAGQTSAQVTFSLSRPADAPVTAAYATSDGTARAGSDYTAESGQVAIPTGASSVVESFPVTGDTVNEPNESFVVTASAPSGASLGDATGGVTITNDDVAPPPPTPALSIANASVTEAQTGTKNVVVTVTLDRAPTGAVSVKYATSNGTARAATDYVSETGTVRFAAGVRTATITLAIRNDKVRESKENYNVTLSAPSGATMADSAGVVTIVDND
jgi:hypothetical protein